MLKRGKMDRGVAELVDTESLVPEGHLKYLIMVEYSPQPTSAQ